MLIPRPTLLFAAALSAGCTYDWTVGEGPGDASVLDGTVQDAPIGTPDGAFDGAPPHDAGGDAAAPTDAGSDAPVTACAQLASDLAKAQATAQHCTGTVGDCSQTFVVDECLCKRWVLDSAHAPPYQAAVDKFEDAGCTPTCVGACNNGVTQGTCLAKDGGATYACYP